MEETRKALEDFFDKMLGSIQYFKKETYEEFFKEAYDRHRSLIMSSSTLFPSSLALSVSDRLTCHTAPFAAPRTASRFPDAVRNALRYVSSNVTYFALYPGVSTFAMFSSDAAIFVHK